MDYGLCINMVLSKLGKQNKTTCLSNFVPKVKYTLEKMHRNCRDLAHNLNFPLYVQFLIRVMEESVCIVTLEDDIQKRK